MIGAVSGLLFALVFAAIFNALGLTWVPPAAAERVPLTIMVLGQNRMMIGTTVALIAIAAFSAWLPARRAAGLKIVEALRHA